MNENAIPASLKAEAVVHLSTCMKRNRGEVETCYTHILHNQCIHMSAV